MTSAASTPMPRSRAGDLVLREVASILAESVRLVDTIRSVGADEFVLVAPGGSAGGRWRSA
ncbi:MAG: diguanylate cyclase [Chloroflexota bacterium]